MTAIAFTVPGVPQPKGRPRVGKGGNIYTPGKTAAYERAVRDHARAAVARIRLVDTWDPAALMGVSLRFYRPTAQRVDVDNLVKSVMDGLNTVVFDDDAQVAEFHAYRYYRDPNPRVEIKVWTVDAVERNV